MKRQLQSIIVLQVLLAAIASFAVDGSVSLEPVQTPYGSYAAALEFLEASGYPYQWNSLTQRLTFRVNEHTIDISTATNLVNLDDIILTLPARPRFLRGVLMLPRSFFDEVMEARLGIAVSWNRRQESDASPETPTATPRQAAVLRVVAIDPGHGGRDDGATSSNGIKEKDIVLAVALRLAALLETRAGIQPVLTRTGDDFVPLSQRARIANEASADLFLSIHANAFRERSISGLETYYLNFDPSDEEARAMALAENQAINYEDVAVGFSDNLDDLKVILWDLVRTEHLQESARLAEFIQENLCLAMETRNRGVRQAPFFVLMGAEMPSTLTEIGFLSNPDDAAALSDPGVQDRIARALFEAILRYDAHLTTRTRSPSPVRLPAANVIR